jgi:hypothetical protein
LKAIRPLKIDARMIRNMHVPAYDPAEFGVQLLEYRGVLWAFVKTPGIPGIDDPMSIMMTELRR